MKPPAVPRQSTGDALDFEATDFAVARRALDELPAGLEAARQARATNWESRRRPALPSDHAIAGKTVEWILKLAPNARPHRLAESTPRIANALADRWPDPAAAAAYVADLLIDRRGRRRGFPPEIKKELVMLHLMLRRNRPPPAALSKG